MKLAENPLWYKDAVIYQTHVKSFYDSNDDGIGDFRGLIEKLDYLQRLGVTAIWLLPFYPSPLRDDGYDIADYYSVHPMYGTLEDFTEFLAQSHQRGMRVITELVLNHTSDQNAWFQKSRRSPAGSEWREFYVWSDTPQRYQEARIIFKDFETSNWSWDPVAKAYFWHRFYSHQPDLNFDNPKVHEAVFDIIDFWLNLGVDGLRLDAVPYLYERENTNCENLPQTHAFLRKLRKHIDKKFKNRMLLAEANQWPEDAVAYFGDGDECHMCFHFPLMPRMFMALQMEDRFPIIDILDQTPQLPETSQWATFLRNHDELTLEMVTDEERDYMYRMYARDRRARVNLGIRRRLAPLLANSRRKIEFINTLLLSLPGTPIIYYGDEIGMGDNIYLGDRNGVRTPMQWSSDRNAGFSKSNPQQLYLPIIIDPEYHYEAINVEIHEKNPSSLLWWMRRVISMRKKLKALGRGSISFLYPENAKVLAFVREYEDQTILVVVNLSRFTQVAEINLENYRGCTPVEVFSQNHFPRIGESIYTFTLGPHAYHWLALEKEQAEVESGREFFAPEYDGEITWQKLLDGEETERFEEAVLPDYVQSCRWFGGKARTLRGLKVIEKLPLPGIDPTPHLLLLEASYLDIAPEIYLLPLQLSSGDRARQIAQETPRAVLVRYNQDQQETIVHDALYDERFRAALLQLMDGKGFIKGDFGRVAGEPGRALADFNMRDAAQSQVLKVEQSNSSVVYGQKLFLKLYRRLEEGINPDSEILRFLSEKVRFEHVPQFGGSISYTRRGSEPRVLGLLLGLVPNEGDAWELTVDAVGRYFERVLTEEPSAAQTLPRLPLFCADDDDVPSALSDAVGGVYPERAKLLGRRTAEMHVALASDDSDPDFAPEPFSTLYQRSVYQSMRSSLRRMMQMLEKRSAKLPARVRDQAEMLRNSEAEILRRQSQIMKRKIVATKIRIHGDYHLGQVLNTGKDFVIIDFEGEPARSLSERKLKRSALRDVAGMLRSFHYAAHTALARLSPREEDVPVLKPWADAWADYVSRVLLRSYLATTKNESFIPASPQDMEFLLDAFLLDKAVYEVGYELNNRPTWLPIPIGGILAILESPQKVAESQPS
jgi:maltose alpha-D-glucosyltransferase / alpha-amylase